MSSYKPHTLLILCATLGTGTALAEKSLDDPMRPPSMAGTGSHQVGGKMASGTQSGYHLSAIRIHKESRRATINGKSVGVGEYIGTARVATINAASVTLKQNGRVIALPLLPLSIKTPVEHKQP